MSDIIKFDASLFVLNQYSRGKNNKFCSFVFFWFVFFFFYFLNSFYNYLFMEFAANNTFVLFWFDIKCWSDISRFGAFLMLYFDVLLSINWHGYGFGCLYCIYCLWVDTVLYLIWYRFSFELILFSVLLDTVFVLIDTDHDTDSILSDTDFKYGIDTAVDTVFEIRYQTKIDTVSFGNVQKNGIQNDTKQKMSFVRRFCYYWSSFGGKTKFII